MTLRRIGILATEEKSINDSGSITPEQRRSMILRARRRRRALMEILDNIAIAREFIAGMNFVDFLSDTKTKYAVITSLTVIGKRLRYIPMAERKLITEVPWRSLQATIRIANQQEWGLVERLIWETVSEDFLLLKQTVETLLKEKS